MAKKMMNVRNNTKTTDFDKSVSNNQLQFN